MKSFLYSVASDIIAKHGTNLSNVVVVFPNKRASLFLNKHLLSIVGKPIWSPHYITISELFREHSQLTVTDNIKAICVLYDVYKKITGTTQSLDAFWSWGEMLLADFDDLDKNMGDASIIYNNVSDLHAFDSVDYLDEEKKEVLKKFFNEFTDDHESRLKHNFEMLWNKLYDIYREFNDALRNEGLAYEGAMYREVCNHIDDVEWQEKKYIFVGFNMIQKVEQTLFKSLKRKGLSYFYWDYDLYYRDNPNMEAGRFIAKWLTMFPNELDINNADIYDGFSQQKDITIIKAATENIQVRNIGNWLSEKGRMKGNTAIVLSDESLLKSVIHYLPKEISSATNITIGYPLSQTPVTTFVKNFITLHIHGYNVNQQLFVRKHVDSILLHPYAMMLTEEVQAVYDELCEERVGYPTPQQLYHDEMTRLLFTPIDCNTDEINAVLINRLLTLLQNIGENSEKQRRDEAILNGIDPDKVSGTYENQFLQESVFRMYNLITRFSQLIAEGTLSVNSNTMLRLLDQVIQSTTMPFHGEPAVDFQVMGVLETRNLDFDHLLILSCNDGKLPKGINDTSLIPHIVRKSHELTTVDNKVAIYAYYFYRMIQRCPDVTIAYNCSTEDGSTGQMSRFVLQLMAEHPDTTQIHHLTLTANQNPENKQGDSIEKTPEVMEVLNGIKYLSPSLINKYLRCPLQFYYSRLAGLKEVEADSIADNRLFGTILHASAEIMYNNVMDADKVVHTEELKKLVGEKGHIRIKRFVDEAFSQKLFQGRQPRYDGLQRISREVVIRFILRLLEADIKLGDFSIMGLEESVYGQEVFTVDGQKRSITIGGSIDRLDKVQTPEGEVLRVIDYKTGGHTPKVFDTVKDIFDSNNIESKCDYYLQAMMYSKLVRHSQKERIMKDKDGNSTTKPPLNPDSLRVLPALLFIQKSESVNDPVLKLGGKDPYTITDILNHEHEYNEGLHSLFNEIFSASTPFVATDKEKECNRCSYRTICKG